MLERVHDVWKGYKLNPMNREWTLLHCDASLDCIGLHWASLGFAKESFAWIHLARLHWASLADLHLSKLNTYLKLQEINYLLKSKITEYPHVRDKVNILNYTSFYFHL